MQYHDIISPTIQELLIERSAYKYNSQFVNLTITYFGICILVNYSFSPSNEQINRDNKAWCWYLFNIFIDDKKEIVTKWRKLWFMKIWHKTNQFCLSIYND